MSVHRQRPRGVEVRATCFTLHHWPGWGTITPLFLRPAVCAEKRMCTRDTCNELREIRGVEVRKLALLAVSEKWKGRNECWESSLKPDIVWRLNPKCQNSDSLPHLCRAWHFTFQAQAPGWSPTFSLQFTSLLWPTLARRDRVAQRRAWGTSSANNGLRTKEPFSWFVPALVTESAVCHGVGKHPSSLYI